MFAIDLLRVLAILAIVYFHGAYELTYNNQLRKIGFIGVSLFFIISGFTLAKKYPALEKFSPKWFLARFIKIASLYYLAILAIIILFGKQTYSGSLITNLATHAFFVDPLFSQTAYGIISPAWFLTPLMALYLIFPYLNNLVKKNPLIILLIAFIITVLVRLQLHTYTDYSPFFFIGEFCFGIAFAYNNKLKSMAASILTILVFPFMFLPFLIFYAADFLNKTHLSSKILSWLGSLTLPIFLFHESFLKVAAKKWHIASLNLTVEIILLAITMLIAIYLSGKIQSFLLEKKPKSTTQRSKD